MEQHTHHSPNGSNGSKGVTLVSVSDASELLGISTSGVRKRINRGSLPARKIDGQWKVVLDEEQIAKASAEQSANLAATRQQLGVIRDEWLQPLILRIGNQAEQIGRLEERIRHLERERNELIAERNELRSLLESAPEQESRSRPGRPRQNSVSVAGLHLTEQVALAGIGLTLGLWMVVGLLAWLMVM